jgi:glycosyltransferase involved in cell wall biosynthesis
VSGAEPLSWYVLTYNSERHLDAVLTSVRELVDDLVIVDSGSHDATRDIAARHGARFTVRQLDSFSTQRAFALDLCRHPWVLCLDSDELADAELVHGLERLKRNGFRLEQTRPDAFRVRRRWFFLNREVHAFYPIKSPDYPIRLLRKDRGGFGSGSRPVHESPKGFASVARMPGSIAHYSCDSVDDLYAKLDRYTALAARDLRARGVTAGWLEIYLRAVAAFVKWYVAKGGWRDGSLGWVLGRYAFDYTYRKYLKLRHDAPATVLRGQG